MLKVDQQFGLYTIKEQLTRGDERASCRASDPFLGHDVVLQLIKLPKQCSDEHSDALEQRLEGLAALEHPVLAPIYDIGREQGLTFYTSAYYEGGNLSRGLKSCLLEKDGLRILKRIAEGLTYAQNKGFEHGPISADEIFWDESGLPVLVDFGVSEVLKDSCAPGADSASSDKYTKTTLYSLGLLFLSLVLAAEQQSRSLVDQVEQLKGDQEKLLIGTLLGLTPKRITNYNRLVKQLNDAIDSVISGGLPEKDQEKHEELSPVTPAPIVPQKEKAGSSEEMAPETSPSREKVVEQTTSPQQSQTESNEPEEPSKPAKNFVEKFLAETSPTEEETGYEKSVVAEQIDYPSKRGRPQLLWILAVCLAAAVFSAGVFYDLLGVDFWVERPSEISQRISIQRVPIVKEFTKVQAETVLEKSAEPEVSDVAEKPVEAAPVAVDVSPEKADWLTPGEEFGQKAETVLSFTTDLAKELPEEEKIRILRAIQSWTAAWESQKFADYMSHYSSRYRTEAGQSRTEWIMVRQSRLERPKWITVELDNLHLTSVGSEQVRVRMDQRYRSDVYGDRSIKSLDFVREKDLWKISMERSY